MSEKKVTIYFPGDGTAVVRWPLGVIPDADTVERIRQILNEHSREVNAHDLH